MPATTPRPSHQDDGHSNLWSLQFAASSPPSVALSLRVLTTTAGVHDELRQPTTLFVKISTARVFRVCFFTALMALIRYGTPTSVIQLHTSNIPNAHSTPVISDLFLATANSGLTIQCDRVILGWNPWYNSLIRPRSPLSKHIKALRHTKFLQLNSEAQLQPKQQISTMTFPRASSLIFAIVASTIFAAATPGGAPSTKTTTPPKTVTVTKTAVTTATAIPASQCTTGPVQCCNSVQKADSPSVTSILGLLGIVLSSVDVLVALTCSPLTVIGVGGTSCSAQTVCCENNNFNGLIALGCIPINLSL
ncbi:hypothetical protein AB1N83_012983 [Pleurotus pulmonarius]